jgi:hypothetical protein
VLDEAKTTIKVIVSDLTRNSEDRRNFITAGAAAGKKKT